MNLLKFVAGLNSYSMQHTCHVTSCHVMSGGAGMRALVATRKILAVNFCLYILFISARFTTACTLDNLLDNDEVIHYIHFMRTFLRADHFDGAPSNKRRRLLDRYGALVQGIDLELFRHRRLADSWTQALRFLQSGGIFDYITHYNIARVVLWLRSHVLRLCVYSRVECNTCESLCRIVKNLPAA